LRVKGIVFTEFLEMVEDKFSLAMVDQIIQRSGLESGGVYTAVGTYPPAEMVRLVTELSSASGVAVPDLLKTFGRHLLTRFAKGFPQFFEGTNSALTFLQHVEDYIHVEVRKLYPDAELPTFECDASVPGRLVMDYRSPRRLADLAEGLMQGCADYFGESIEITRNDLSSGGGEHVRFTLVKKDGLA
jgi:hypothetical protein